MVAGKEGPAHAHFVLHYRSRDRFQSLVLLPGVAVGLHPTQSLVVRARDGHAVLHDAAALHASLV